MITDDDWMLTMMWDYEEREGRGLRSGGWLEVRGWTWSRCLHQVHRLSIPPPISGSSPLDVRGWNQCLWRQRPGCPFTHDAEHAVDSGAPANSRPADSNQTRGERGLPPVYRHPTSDTVADDSLTFRQAALHSYCLNFSLLYSSRTSDYNPLNYLLKLHLSLLS